MKTLIGLLIVLFFVTSSCGAPKKNWKHTKDNVSFMVPGDWKISEKDNLDDGGYYLSIEKDGLESSGLYILSWVNRHLDSLYYLGQFQQGFKDRKELENLEFGAVRNTDYNGIPAISSDYSFSMLNEESRGTIYIFSKLNRTYSVTEQGTVEDVSENQTGFELIESTFKIK